MSKERQKELRDQRPEWFLWSIARDRARRRSVEFDIQISDIKIPKLCPILLVPLERFTNYAPSVDRVDNRLGYIKGNVRIISKRANSMKGNMSLEDIERLHAYAKGQQE